MDTTIDDSPVLNKLYEKQYPVFNTPSQRVYQIRMRAFAGALCINEVVKPVILSPVPDVRINTIPGICLEAQPRQLTQGFDATNNTGQGIYSGPGVIASGIFNPQVAGVGAHIILYRFTTNDGCSDSAATSIIVWPRPTANLNVSAITCVGAPVIFSSTSTSNSNQITKWNWNFGDGNSQIRNNGDSFSHTYSNVQNYQVNLIVTTDSGCTSIPATRTISIHPNPVADFTLPAVVCLPEGRANFTNTSTSGGTVNTPMTYQWNFGIPGGTSSAENPTFFFSNTGPFNIQLRTTSATGCVDSITKILNTIRPQPLANFTVNSNEGCIGASKQFSDVSNPLNNTITSWTWQFDDGGRSNLRNPSHVFNRTGIFLVKMFYTTAAGCNSDTVEKRLTIYPFPIVDAGPDQIIRNGGEVTLKASVRGSSGYQYRWAPATALNNPSVLQPISRTQVEIMYILTVSGSGGCSSSDSVFVRLLKLPEITNAFSPNGDGINDTWIIRNLDSYPGATVQVFDRYGKAILKSNGYNIPWDGKNNGIAVPAGVYYYIVDPKNGLKPTTGPLTIIR